MPEVDAVFVRPETFTVGFFVRMNNTGGPVDVWAVDDIEQSGHPPCPAINPPPGAARARPGSR